MMRIKENVRTPNSYTLWLPHLQLGTIGKNLSRLFLRRQDVVLQLFVFRYIRGSVSDHGIKSSRE